MSVDKCSVPLSVSIRESPGSQRSCEDLGEGGLICSSFLCSEIDAVLFCFGRGSSMRGIASPVPLSSNHVISSSDA